MMRWLKRCKECNTFYRQNFTDCPFCKISLEQSSFEEALKITEKDFHPKYSDDQAKLFFTDAHKQYNIRCYLKNRSLFLDFDLYKNRLKYGNEQKRKIPVIAAGGIYDGRDIARFLKLGASGVQIATRFACTYECDAADEFKQAYINAKKEDIIIIRSPVGMPGRAIRNEFLEKSKRGEIKFNCYYQCLKTCVPSKSPYCIAEALINAAEGNLEGGFVFTGSNAYKIDRIVSVKDLIKELVEETEANL